MATRRFILASASPARLALLRAAGFAPEVVVTGVPEDDVRGHASDVVGLLARRKAEVAARDSNDALVLGCDSLLEIDGVTWGKAASREDATERWRALRGRVGVLASGHCLIDAASGRSAGAVATANVTFGSPSDREIDAYVATGEPLRVAGSFTIDGYAAPFVTSIEGHPTTVLGCSLPAVRDMLAQLGVEITDLWA